MQKISVSKKSGFKFLIYVFSYKAIYFFWKLFRRFLLRQTNGAQVVVWYRDKVLLVKSSYRSYFCFPGGYLKRNETPLDGAQRELEEESGLYLPLSMFKFCQEFTVKCHKTLCKDTIYEACLDESLDFSLQIDGREIVEASFFTLNEVRELQLDDNALKYFSNMLNAKSFF